MPEEQTGSFIAYGDQKLERDLGVANGFPGNQMSNTDSIVSKDIMEMLSIAVGGKIQVKYDFLALMPSTLKPYEQIIFEYEPTEDEMPTKGELFLETLGYPKDMTMQGLYDEVELHFG